MQIPLLQSPAPSAPAPAQCCARATLRHRARRAAERWLAASPLPALLAGRRAAVVLAYHNVVPAGQSPCGDRSLHLPQAAFAAQLDRLMATHNVLPLNELLTATGPWPRAAVTFDDGYAGAATAGVAELAKRGLPATLFVVAGAAAGTHFWWDLLAGDDGLDPALRADALGRLEGRGDAILHAFGHGDRGAVLQNAANVAFRAIPYPPSPETPGAPTRAAGGGLPAHAAAAGDDALRAAAAVPGITLGSH
ncbi:MAG: polysaccharide deacetylase family protein, partial [Longimicrobiaceae bacterium]